MLTILYTSIDPKGYHGTCHFKASAFETCLETLTLLAANGWVFEQVLLLDGYRKPLALPVNVFDGESFLEPIAQLEQEWQQLLAPS